MFKPSALLTAASVVGLAATFALAHNPRGKVEADFAGKAVTVDYGRPSLNGRDMLSQISPGMVWRLGSENATTISSEGSLMFGAAMIPAGSYSLFAEKTEDGWNLLVNSETGLSGLARDPEKDILSTPLRVETEAESAEMFTITLTANGMNGAMKMQWGEMALVADLMVH